MKTDFAPLRSVPMFLHPWQGSCERKPWHYKVAAAIPCLDTYEQVKIGVRLLQLQTVQPFILLIDTGSNPEEAEKIAGLRADDVEVHTLRLNGVLHPSDFPAMAMDLAFALCRTEFLFATHADCFVRRRDLLEDLIQKCSTLSPVVGYEISPRSHEDWKGMVSHTATMYHIPTMDRIGFGWSMRRLCNLFHIKSHKPDPMRPNWPDTEILGNYILRNNEIKPYLIGSEKNFARTKDENIDHFRSFTSGKLYCPEYFERAKEWYESARQEALERIENWEKEGLKNTGERSI